MTLPHTRVSNFIHWFALHVGKYKWKLCYHAIAVGISSQLCSWEGHWEVSQKNVLSGIDLRADPSGLRTEGWNWPIFELCYSCGLQWGTLKSWGCMFCILPIIHTECCFVQMEIPFVSQAYERQDKVSDSSFICLMLSRTVLKLNSLWILWRFPSLPCTFSPQENGGVVGSVRRQVWLLMRAKVLISYVENIGVVQLRKRNWIRIILLSQ